MDTDTEENYEREDQDATAREGFVDLTDMYRNCFQLFEDEDRELRDDDGDEDGDDDVDENNDVDEDDRDENNEIDLLLDRDNEVDELLNAEPQRKKKKSLKPCG